ncbi:MAG: hypothetical protein IT468_01645 [Rhodocyclaceae bacterium]|nr:hypothetical protein [Rhodocyclaceae bacterium]
MKDETPKEVFWRLCNEMGLSADWRMTRAEIYALRDEWFAQAGYSREQALALAAVRERMETVDTDIASNRSTGLHPIWAAANERLLARRAGNDGGEHGRV